MTQFKVGDRVRLPKGNASGTLPPGATGTVTGHGRSGETVIIDNKYSAIRHYVELVKPPLRFKVGDNAIIATDKWGPRGGLSPFSKGTPVRILHAGKHYDWYVRPLDGTLSQVPINEDEMQSVPSQDFKLRRGDRIVNVKTGRRGHVVEGQDESLWVVDKSHREETGAPAAAVEEYEHHYPGTYEFTNRTTGGPF